MFTQCVTSRAMVASLFFGRSDASCYLVSHPEYKDNFGNQILCTLAEKHKASVYVNDVMCLFNCNALMDGEWLVWYVAF